MAAGEHDGRCTIATAAHRENVADAVDLDAATGVTQPARNEITALPVEVGQREATYAAPGRRADLREVHQRPPQSRAVDT